MGKINQNAGSGSFGVEKRSMVNRMLIYNQSEESEEGLELEEEKKEEEEQWEAEIFDHPKKHKAFSINNKLLNKGVHNPVVPVPQQDRNSSSMKRLDKLRKNN